MPVKGAATLLATRDCPSAAGTGVVAPALVPVLVPPLAVAVTLVAVGVVPVIIPALIVFAVTAVAVPAGAPAPAVDAKLTPVNDIAVIIAHSCFARTFMR